MALVGGASVLAASTQASTDALVADDTHVDFVITSATEDVPPEAVDRLRELPSAATVDAITFGSLLVSDPGATPTLDDATWVLGIDFAALNTRLDIEEIAGSMADVGEDGIAVREGAAEENGWAVGDELTVTTDLGSRTLPIRAVYASTFLDTAVILPEALYAEVMPPLQSVIDTVLMTTTSGTSATEARAAITDVVAPYVVISVQDADEFASSLSAQVDQILVILYALLGLSIVIAVLGIVNTLALSVIERTREIGLLRAVGLGRVQLAGTVTIESVLTAVFGTVVGVGVGVGLAAAMPTVFASVGLTTLAIPWASLGAMLALALVVGVLAALWPALRAARLPVLEAITYE
jgi:putative ABC transport system permease protein